MALMIGGAIGTGVLTLGYIITRSVVGGCRNKPDLQSDFDINEYLGLWYEF